MTKAIKIKEFVISRIAEIDEQYSSTSDNMEKLKYSTMRTSFANILNTYLNQQGQLGLSYLKHSQTYYQVNSYEQAIFYSQLAKKHLKQLDLLQEASLINLKCLLKSNLIDSANDYLKNLAPKFKKKQFLELKVEIMEKIKNEEQTFQCLNQLETMILQEYTNKSVEMGLHFIQKGKKKGIFHHFDEALKLMQQGMNILIDVRFANQLQIGKIYILMATFSRQLKMLEPQYSYLMCAYSMFRQIANQQKQMIDTLHKIVNNLFEREENEDCLKQLLKIETYQKKMYGESSLVLSKTIKKIIEVLGRMSRKLQAKKYQSQYSRIVCCNDRKGMVREKPLKFSQVKLQN